MHEPYRIKVVELLPAVSRAQRERLLAEAGYNPFQIDARGVTVDLVSDSGTGAMSSRQWQEVIGAREDFSGQESYTRFVKTATDTFGFPHVQPVHQGRAAESLLFRLLIEPGRIAVSNTFFETTRANLEAHGCEALDLSDLTSPWCGNIDLARLEALAGSGAPIGMILITVTNNIMGGQPVSLENIAGARRVADRLGVPLVLDAGRFAGNALLRKRLTRSRQSLRRICRETFGLSHAAYLSCKKDGLANVGGMIGLHDAALFERLQHEVIRQESYPTAGGLAARDLAAMTVGLEEAVDERVVTAHVDGVRYLAAGLQRRGVRVFEPVGAHGVVVLPRDEGEFAAFSLAASIFLVGGVRAGVFDGKMRLALPRRTYTRDHLDHVGEVVASVYDHEPMMLACTHRPPDFFDFFARFERRG
ncbi:MAG: tryptophanase [Candidatus Krumholzibacteriia bacterium]